MTLIISTISLGVVVPTLKEEKLMQTNIGQIILLVAVIADLVMTILLAVFSSFMRWKRVHVAPALIICCRLSSSFIWPVATTKSIFQSMSKGTVQIGGVYLINLGAQAVIRSILV
ncbi:sodium:proton antiporter [Bacillus safensis FO-36b] [Bacillus safensis subsp. safensis]